MTIFTTGNTITLAIACTIGGVAAAPDSLPTVRLLGDNMLTVAGATIGTVTAGTTGNYTCHITLPADIGTKTYYAEVTTKSGGETMIGRETIKAAFATSA